MASVVIPAFLVFGGILAIAVIGLVKSNAAARVHGSGPRLDHRGDHRAGSPQPAPHLSGAGRR